MATKHYVNNKTLYEHMKVYHEKLMLSKEDNTSKPPIPNYIGECVLLICTKLSYKPNFMNYSYRDDMIADGIENWILKPIFRTIPSKYRNFTSID